jgi:hypothetical protein
LVKRSSYAAKGFVDQYLIKHEFVKRLHERYLKGGDRDPASESRLPHETRTAVERNAEDSGNTNLLHRVASVCVPQTMCETEQSGRCFCD